MTHNAAHFNPRKRPPSSTSIAGPAKGNNLTGSLAVSGGSRILQFQDLFKSGLFDSCFFLMNLEKSENGYFESSSENILYADLLVKVRLNGYVVDGKEGSSGNKSACLEENAGGAA